VRRILLILAGAVLSCTGIFAQEDACTEIVYNETSTRWKQMEDRYWVMFGMGF